MPSPFVEELLTEYLQGTRSADDARWILRNTDDEVHNGEKLLAEFNSVFSDISKKIPGLAIDYDKLLAGDPIECDPLVSQGNLALLRLDAIYYQAFTAWTKSGKDIHQIKIIRKPENPATYSEKTQQHIHTEENYPPDAQILNQLTQILLSAFRVQATITHRREALQNPPSKRDERSESPSQPEASARNEAQSAPPSKSASDIIKPDEILDDSQDLIGEIKPIDGKIPLIRGVNKLGPLKGITQLIPSLKPNQTAAAHSISASQSAAAQSPTREEEPVTQDTTNKVSPLARFFAPSASLREPKPSPVGSAVRTETETTNSASPQPREEEPVIVGTANKVSLQNPFSVISAPPCELSHFTHNKPAFHKRE